MTGSQGQSHDNILMTTLQSLVNQEAELTRSAGNRLGSFTITAETALAYLNTYVVSVDADHFLAAALQLAIQKSATLAYLSYIRKHHAQGEFNSRQAIEYCALCAYILAHPLEDVTGSAADDPHSFRAPKALSSKAYKWLAKEMPHHSAMLKELKELINDTAAHASLYLTQFTFDWETSMGNEYHGSFFDNVDTGHEQLHLISFARLALIITDTLRRAAEKYGGFVVQDGLEPKLTQLEQRINDHRDALAAKMGREAN